VRGQVIITHKEPEKSGNISLKPLSQLNPRDRSFSDSSLRKAVYTIPDTPGCILDDVINQKNLPAMSWTKVMILKAFTV
jgi:hypothetical protein